MRFQSKNVTMPFRKLFSSTRGILVALNVLQFLICLLLLEYNLSSHQPSYNSQPTSRTAAQLLKRDFSNPSRDKQPLSKTTTTRTIRSKSVRNYHHESYDTTRYLWRREPGHGWHPRLFEITSESKTENQFLESLEHDFFSDPSSLKESQRVVEETDATHHHQDFVAFLRIPKTGSTSLTKLMQRTENLYPQVLFMQEDYDFEEEKPGLGCIFGIASDDQVPDDFDKQDWTCAHLNFMDTMQISAKALRHLEGPKDMSVSIHPFTMVRDPFDRFVSFFYYMYSRRKFELWQESFTKQQNELLEQDDLPQWMELLYEKDTANTFEMMHQQLYFANDIDQARALIDQGRILMLVNECFDLSMKLLSVVFPKIFDREQIALFLEEDQEGQKKFHFMHANDNLHRKDMNVEAMKAKVDFDALRTKAKQWFPEHFEFYHAAQDKFRQHVQAALQLPNSFITQQDADHCFQKLDEKYSR